MVLRSQQGDDVRANIVALCESEHTSYHAHDKATQRKLALYLRAERPDTCAYLVEKLEPHGAEHWFDSRLSE